MAKRKAVNFQIIPFAEDSEPHAVLASMREFHLELEHAAIALAWRKKLKSDKDGRLVLGKCVKVSGLNRELVDYDFVIVLNREMWEYEFNPEQKAALMDHELCHAAPDIDEEEGTHKTDEKGRYLFRIRKHDIEEFREIIDRHGCYKRDLEQFAKAIKRRDEAPLFSDPDVSIVHEGKTVFEGKSSDLTTLANATAMGGTHQKGKRKPSPEVN